MSEKDDKAAAPTDRNWRIVSSSLDDEMVMGAGMTITLTAAEAAALLLILKDQGDRWWGNDREAWNKKVRAIEAKVKDAPFTLKDAGHGD